jgi:hypothetical protein
MNEEGYYSLTVDHSKDIEIHKTPTGTIFGIRNIRQEIEGNVVTFKADIAGDTYYGQIYLNEYAERIIGNVLDSMVK